MYLTSRQKTDGTNRRKFLQLLHQCRITDLQSFELWEKSLIKSSDPKFSSAVRIQNAFLHTGPVFSARRGLLTASIEAFIPGNTCQATFTELHAKKAHICIHSPGWENKTCSRVLIPAFPLIPPIIIICEATLFWVGSRIRRSN